MPTFATLFMGGGGADLGLEAAGFESIWGIERDPKIAEVARLNFPNTKVFNSCVGEIRTHLMERVDLLWMSPPCQQYSNARRGDIPDHKDKDAGLYCCDYIAILSPRWVVLENVPGYAKSPTFEAILRSLIDCGYRYHWLILDAADHGVPQNRKRLIMWAVKNSEPLPYFPESKPKKGWYQAISDLIPEMQDCELADWQIKRLNELGYLPEKALIDIGKQLIRQATVRESNDPSFTIVGGHCNSHSPILLIPRAGACIKNILPTPQNKPCPTIRAMAGVSTHWADIVQGSQIKRISQKATARLQTFPDDYKFPESKSLSQQIIGNAVPPLLAKELGLAILKSINLYEDN
jgi:DNA (cytosine-5)-methyltransferase 1